VIQFSAELLGRGYAPKINDFRTAAIPDLTEVIVDRQWLQNHFLNTIFMSFESSSYDPIRARFVICAFRAKSALVAYGRAKASCEAFFDTFIDGNPVVDLYFDAVAQWEGVALHLHHVVDIFKKANGTDHSKSDVEERLRIVANRIKHVAEYIPTSAHEGLTIPMWLAHDRLETSEATVTYIEIADLLVALARHLDKWQDPIALLKAERS
jgi:hypothetical protein